MTRLIAVTSARGGVGTTSIALNLAAQLAQRGQRVCLLTTAVGGERDLPPGSPVRRQEATGVPFHALLIRDGHGFDILSGPVSATRLGTADPADRQRLAASLAELERYDFVLIDAIGGVDPRLLGLVLASPEVILTVTPQPLHLLEGYALLKLLTARGYPGEVSLLVNCSAHPAAAERAYTRFSAAAHRHLDRQLSLFGVVREDLAMHHDVMAQAALLSYLPTSPAAQDLAALVAQLLADTRTGVSERQLRGLAEAWLQVAGGAEALPALRLSAAPTSAQQSRRDLEQQIETLSAQIDDLLTEINRLRTEGEDIARLVTSPGGRLPRVAGDAIETRVANLASGPERRPPGEAGFPVYPLCGSGGDLLRVALHSCNSRPEQTAPQSTSS